MTPLPQRVRTIGRVIAALLLVACSPGLALAQGKSAGEGEQIHWKSVTGAQVKLDDKTPLAWSIYQPDKKDKKAVKKPASLVLLLLGHRYLMLDIDERLAYEVPRASLQAHGEDFDTANPPADAHAISTAEWTFRDVGPAELIRFTLGDYGRALEISLPHPPDMRPFY